jgi:hypothetical protein
LGAVLLGAAATAPVGAGKEYSDEEIAAAAKAAIAERAPDRTLRIFDARTGEHLELVFDDVRIVRGLKGFGWFPNVAFHDKAAPQKKYALDLWLRPDGERLKLVDMRIHKAPKADGSGWMSVTRSPLAWWWLPTMERASAVATMPAWQVMGAIHTKIAEAKRGDSVLPKGAGDRPLGLEVVDVLQPVGRSKADGRYFVCVEFAAPGTQLARYVADYWFEPKSKDVRLGHVAPQKIGSTDAVKAATEPRCDVGGIAFDVVD